MVKSRCPMRVDPTFKKSIDALQRRIRMKGDDLSRREITRRINSYPEFEKIMQDIFEKKVRPFVKAMNFDGRGI